MVVDNGNTIITNMISIIFIVLCKYNSLMNLSCAKVTSCLSLLVIICFETVLLSAVSDCTKAFYIHWNTSNPIFRSDNLDHIISVNQGNTQFEYDQVNIICPVYTPGTHESDEERYIIYNVSKEEYETCRITNPSPRIIAICDKPNKLMYYTITFRPFTPQPGGLEFPPGQDYYFISTSSREDLHRRIGGRCASNNMKVIFKVCCQPNDDKSRQRTSTQLSGGNDWPPTSATTQPPSYTSSVINSYFSERPHHKIATTTESVFRAVNKPVTKKVQEFPYHPNDVLKNEELSRSNASIIKSSGYGVGITALLLTILTASGLVSYLSYIW